MSEPKLQSIIDKLTITSLDVESVISVNENQENTILNIMVLNLDLRNEEQVTSVIEWIRQHFEDYKEPKSKQHKPKPINENILRAEDHEHDSV
jgi:hypothetical protein